MKKLLVLSLLLNAALIGLFAYKKLRAASFVASKHAVDWSAFIINRNKERVAYFSRHPISTGDVVFLGTSLSEAFPLHDHFGRVKNRGVGGNRLEHMLTRIEEITAKKPDKIFIEAGINDVINNIPIDTIKARFERLVTLIKQGSPATKIFINSVTPTSLEYALHMPAITKVNEYLRDYCSRNEIGFIEAFEPLLKDGVLDSACTDDGLHLNEEGYTRWAKVLQPYAE